MTIHRHHSLFLGSLFFLLIFHLFTPSTIFANKEVLHRVWIDRVDHGDGVRFKFHFKESNDLVFVENGKEIKRITFAKNETKLFSFQEWDRFPMVRFCNNDGTLSMYFLTKKSFNDFDCKGTEVELSI